MGPGMSSSRSSARDSERQLPELARWGPPRQPKRTSAHRHYVPLDREMTFPTNFKGDFNEKKINYSFSFLWSYVPVLFSGFFCRCAPQSKEAKQIIALVDKAAALTESKGKSAFPEFKKKGSEWLKGETYIFIIDMNGTTLMHPANPQLETKNVLDLKDENGKAFVREFIETAKKGSGWVDYMWPKPGEKKPAKK